MPGFDNESLQAYHCLAASTLKQAITLPALTRLTRRCAVLAKTQPRSWPTLWRTSCWLASAMLAPPEPQEKDDPPPESVASLSTMALFYVATPSPVSAIEPSLQPGLEAVGRSRWRSRGSHRQSPALPKQAAVCRRVLPCLPSPSSSSNLPRPRLMSHLLHLGVTYCMYVYTVVSPRLLPMPICIRPYLLALISLAPMIPSYVLSSSPPISSARASTV
jgi:hypothetical protein